MNLNFEYKTLKLNKNYLHDGRKNNHAICEVDDIRKALEKNYPLVGIYRKDN